MTASDRNRQAEIQARVSAATEGPWQADMAWVQVSADQQICEGYDDEQGLDDVQFIAHAREDVPWLLAELEASRAQEGTLREALRQAIIVAEAGGLTNATYWLRDAKAALAEAGVPVAHDPPEQP